jgi:ubiquinone/menaquinone biosynthesis C-methylase UbiE
MSRVERAFCRGSVWRRATATVVGTLPIDRLGRDVLEIGSGSGAVADRLLRDNTGITLTATDLDPLMVDTTTRRLQSFPDATVVAADVTDLPFAENSFDSVVSCLMLHHVVEWERAIAEVARVLRPGGSFVGYDLVRTPFAIALHHFDRSPFRLVTPDELADTGAKCGLTIDVRTRLFGHVMQFASR